MILTPLEKYQKDLQAACRKANTIDWFERYINKSRGLGNTDALLAGCKLTDATLIVHSATLAEELRAAKQVRTTHVGDPSFAIAPTKSVLDNHAVYQLVTEQKQLIALAEQLLQLMAQKGMAAGGPAG